MDKTAAVKRIFDMLDARGIPGGMPRAVTVYNRITHRGEIAATADLIDDYFRLKGRRV